MTTFQKGDRVTAVKGSHLPYWSDLIYVEKRGTVHIAEQAHGGSQGGFVDGELALIATYPAALDTTKALQTVDGKKVTFIGKMEDGRIVVSVSYPSRWPAADVAPTELRYADGRKSNRPGVTSGDDVVVKVVEKTTFRNVYANGKVGDTVHATQDAATQRSKLGQVRIGLMEQLHKDGVLFSARLVVASPWYRDASVRNGRPAVPADYAR